MTDRMGERGRQGAAPLGGHTPGPWEVIADPAAGAWFRVSIPIRRQVYNESFITHREADARLIAAAPELLDALGSMVAVHFEAHGPHPIANCKAVPCQKATKAIDAAEGPDSW